MRVLIKWVCDYAFFIIGQEIESFLLAKLVAAASEMSSKLKGRPAENGEHSESKMENGVDSTAAPALNTYTPEEMVQQMKELITENNELKGEWMRTWAALKIQEPLVSSEGFVLSYEYEFCACLPLLGSIHCINNSASDNASLIRHINRIFGSNI